MKSANFYTNILFILCILLFFSCSITKKVEEGDYLLVKNKIYENDKFKLSTEAYESIYQKKQTEIKIPPIRLWMYNMSRQPLDSVLRIWYSDENRTNKDLDSLLTLSDLAQWKKKPINLWFNKIMVNNEKKPVVLDTTMIEKSKKSILNYYKLKEGYLNAAISSEVTKLPEIKDDFSENKIAKYQQLQLKNKKAKVNYYLDLGNRYYIDSIYYHIADSAINNLYKNEIENSFLVKGKPYNEDLFINEQSRIVKQMRDNGYYDFTASNIKLQADSTILGSNKIIGIITIDKAYVSDTYNKKYRLKEVNVFPKFVAGSSYDKPHDNPIKHKGYAIYYPTDSIPSYKPRVFSDLLIIDSNQLYSVSKDDQTKRNLNRFENFTIPEVRYEKDTESDSLLIANVYFNERSKYSLDVGLDVFTSSYLTIGLSPTASLLTRNVFGGGENFELNVKLTGGNTGNVDNASGFAFEATAGGKLSFPRFVIPFYNSEKIFNKEAEPQTDISITASWQKQIGLGRISLSSDYDYLWKTRKRITHKLEVSNIQYIQNVNADQYFNLYTSDKTIRDAQYDDYFAYDNTLEPDSGNYDDVNFDLISNVISNDQGFQTSTAYDDVVYNDYATMVQRQRRITENVLINSSAYSFEYDERVDKLTHPFYFKGKIELAGNSLYLLDQLNLTKNATNIETSKLYTNKIIGVGYAQFAKIDIDVRKYFTINKYNTLANRFVLGYALPYGNAQSVPFSRTYFAGGSGDIRAWSAYDLGPGSVPRGSQSYSTDLFKLLANFELRHKVNEAFETALFIDAGNIWSTASFANEEAKFFLNSFYKQLAIGTGFGLRYNFGYNIIARLDFAYKINDPNILNSRWLDEFKIFKPRINFGIGYPF